jgi:hypothetical protein
VIIKAYPIGPIRFGYLTTCRGRWNFSCMFGRFFEMTDLGTESKRYFELKIIAQSLHAQLIFETTWKTNQTSGYRSNYTCTMRRAFVPDGLTRQWIRERRSQSTEAPATRAPPVGTLIYPSMGLGWWQKANQDFTKLKIDGNLKINENQWRSLESNESWWKCIHALKMEKSSHTHMSAFLRRSQEDSRKCIGNMYKH